MCYCAIKWDFVFVNSPKNLYLAVGGEKPVVYPNKYCILGNLKTEVVVGM